MPISELPIRSLVVSPPDGRINSGITGKCLDYAAVSGSSAINAILNDCSSSASQQWNLKSRQIAINGKCLDLWKSVYE